MIKTDAASIQAEYQKGKAYNNNLWDEGLYEIVERNENMYVNKCWEGINAPDLEKLSIPLLKRAVSQFISMIVSDDIASQITARQPGAEQAVEILQREIDNIIEDEKMKSKNRMLLRDAAVDGDCCLYVWFDPYAKTGQEVEGRIRATIVDNTNVLFGNPHDHEVEPQPYILLPLRLLVDDVKREAKQNGVPQDDIDQIKADDDPDEYMNQYSQGDLATLIIKLYRNEDTGTIWATKVCGNVVIRKPWDLKYRLYPIAYMPWDVVKNCYHGEAAVSGLIPNQIAINKTHSMMMYYIKRMAFPKVAYDKMRLPNGFNNKLAEAIGVNGNPNEIFATPIQMPDMSNQVFVMVDKLIQYTKDFIGASDITLGNARPENTSAIIALTKASAMPLEIQRLNFYQFVEDYIKIFIEIIATDYGKRMTIVEDEGTGEEVPAEFDFNILREIDFKLNIDVGQSAYWSELMQIQTNDSMWMNGVIQDPIDYLENIPNGILKNKNKLINKFKQLQAMMAMMPPPGEMPPDEMGGMPPDQGGAPPPMM
jgi:hypothetical protein